MINIACVINEFNVMVTYSQLTLWREMKRMRKKQKEKKQKLEMQEKDGWNCIPFIKIVELNMFCLQNLCASKMAVFDE